MKYQTLSFFVGAGSSKNMLGITTTDASAPDLDKFNQHLTECCNKLHDAGYPVARRTVTKYRKLLNIASSRQRKDWMA